MCYENPSPGNKQGGITTLEDKSLGCTQKAGLSKVVDVLTLGQQIQHKGLNLLKGPGNDMVACSNLACAGAHVILFTTGRGTPFGTFVPTMKIATNTALSVKKANWIDFNAGKIVDGKSMEEVFEEFQITPSTIRNYRQKLREKQQQAKFLMALTHLIEDEKKKGTIHLNRKEKLIIQSYFTVDGKLKELPSKEKKKMVVLKHIIQPMKIGKVYSDNDVMKLLKGITRQPLDLKEELITSGLLVVDENNNYTKQKSK